MTTDMSWMVKDIVDNVPGARHAVVLSADGLPRGATDRLTDKDVKTISAAMSGMQSLSRATAHFVGAAQEQQWNQTVIEFSHGWVFLIGAGQGAYLAAAAEPDVDLQQLSFRMNRLVARLGNNLTSPPRAGLDDPSRTSDAVRPQRVEAGGSNFVLKQLDQVVDEVDGALHALLLGADGLPRGATSGIGQDLADTMSAAMTGIHAYSRAAADFAGGSQDAEWQQTVIEYQHGWIFLIAAGDDGFLAAAAEHACDIEKFTTRLCDAVPGILAPESRGERADHV